MVMMPRVGRRGRQVLLLLAGMNGATRADISQALGFGKEAGYKTILRLRKAGLIEYVDPTAPPGNNPLVSHEGGKGSGHRESVTLDQTLAYRRLRPLKPIACDNPGREDSRA